MTDRKWHPIQSTCELEPGRWQLVEQYGHVYGEVALVRHAGVPRYRAEVERDRERALVGYFPVLLDAVEAVHRVWLAGHGATGAPVAGWGELGQT